MNENKEQIVLRINKNVYMTEHLMFYKNKVDKILESIFSEKILDKEIHDEIDGLYKTNQDAFDELLSEKQHEKEFVKYEFLKLFILGMYDLWERDIKTFLFKHGLESDKKEEIIKMHFDGIKKIFDCNNDSDLDFLFEQIKELSLVANIIKHGEGRSLAILYQKNKKFFTYGSEFEEKFPESAKYGFRVSKNGLDYFYDILLSFWHHLFALNEITIEI